MKHILITGATGFIGRNYLYALLKENVKITVVSRTKSVNKTKVLFPEVNVIALDLEIGNLETLNLKALDSVTEVVHIAGGYDIQMDFKDAYKNNILLGQNLIRIIKKLNNIEMVHLISSFSVVGNENNKNFQEDDLCIDERMMNNYSFSKAKAEELFRNSAKELNFRLRIYRPGIVIESRVGKVMDKIDGPYYFSSELLKYKKIIRSMLFLTIPFSKKARLPLVSIECLTKNLVYATLKPSKDHQIRCYYFFSDNQVSVDKLLNAFFKI